MVVDDLLVFIAEESALLSELLDLLKSEEQYLLQGDLESLSDNTVAKSGVVRQISLLGQRRLSALVSSGFAPKESSMLPFIHSCASPQLTKIWDELMQLATQTRELNKTNGLLLSRLSAYNQNALNVLQRHQRRGSSSLYGPDGQNATISTIHTIVS